MKYAHYECQIITIITSFLSVIFFIDIIMQNDIRFNINLSVPQVHNSL